ncbi:MAG TPA: Do family serine endopeptidase [Steroidobacteraceae bacterium]|jgi:Do/DeqQ family serine protease|nr:Do family serine endopeptidase [Steroidobacteraceae bacterium]
MSLRSLRLACAAALIFPLQAQSVAGPSAAVALPSLAPMIKIASPGVVNIATRGTLTERVRRNPLLEDPYFRRFFNVPDSEVVRQRQFQSAGSGVIVDAQNGYIVTNRHVIENASEITVTLLDTRHFSAKVVGSDEATDIAVLKVSEPHLTAMALGDSSHLEVGDWVVAIGNPFALGHTVTVGIVSALGRTGIHPRGYEEFIQTDASINPGNSGGALVDLRGELVGINSAILSKDGGNIGIGFAIPVNMVKAVMGQLIQYGAVKRGIVGIKLQDLTPEATEALQLVNSRGVLITAVAPGSAADHAGVKAGDIAVAMNGVALDGATQLRNALAVVRVGQTVELRLLHEGGTRTVVLKVNTPGTAADSW